MINDSEVELDGVMLVYLYETYTFENISNPAKFL